MLKGYWVITVPFDEQVLLDTLLNAMQPVFRTFGAQPLPKDNRAEDHIAGARQIVQIVEFRDRQAANACLSSQGYAMTGPLRERFGTFHLIVVEQESI